ncbi:MAG: ferritin family protein [Gammaproteobacteria bacterium]|nr:ferritin family protein [Gammaproteobacteria bacterium]
MIKSRLKEWGISSMLSSVSVKSARDLMSIALQAEREAIRRYSQLAVSMHEGKNESVAALFERMVIEEREHERLLLEWMTQENIDENPEIDPVIWRDPQVSTTYDEEARDPYCSTPYKVLAFAVHNEEIAFRFYTHVAAESENEAVRKYAEILAREELGHAALLRAERRRAYHAEREASIAEPRLNPKAIHNEVDLLTAAIQIDRHLVDEMNVVEESYPKLGPLIAETKQLISGNEQALNNKTSPGEDIIRNLEQVALYNVQMDKNANTSDSRLQLLWACCDRSFAFYDAIVEDTKDETVMLAAQKLTSLALDRIGVMKQVFGG